jgi:hypothetical protein
MGDGPVVWCLARGGSPLWCKRPEWLLCVMLSKQVHRWFGSESADAVASQLASLRRGTLGYLYKLPDVPIAQVGPLGHAHVMQEEASHTHDACF